MCVRACVRRRARELQHPIDPLWITLSWRVTDMGIIHRRFLPEIDHRVGTERINPRMEAITVEERHVRNRKFDPTKESRFPRPSPRRHLCPFTSRWRKKQFPQLTTGSNAFCNWFIYLFVFCFVFLNFFMKAVLVQSVCSPGVFGRLCSKEIHKRN